MAGSRQLLQESHLRRRFPCSGDFILRIWEGQWKPLRFLKTRGSGNFCRWEILRRKTPMDRCQEAYSEHLRRGGSPDTIPLEETDDEVFTRVRQWIKRVLDEAIDEISADRKLIDAAFNLSVLCVSHSGLIRATLGHLFNIDSSEISVPNASISIVEIKAGGCDGFIAKLVQPPDDSHMGPESYSRNYIINTVLTSSS
uniref:Phosphoglycerate mutase n=1 Tax=Corethron hystrix TaxID=216773 RepID=A0A7S1B8V8_9STRA|mmetsp:Transcript_17050/g.38367  ORF Transcript_17050/g.38367 Transcript_17050/m.38367 type:complete len:198 (+) Transcript_17050:600-1193(+)